MDKIIVELDERSTRAIHQSITFTLTHYTGQEDLDQEQLITLKHGVQAALLEWTLSR